MKAMMKTTFSQDKVLEEFYTGGKVEIDASGKQLYCTCGDVITIIDTDTGEKIAQLKDDGDDITCFSISPNNEILVTATKSLLLHQYDIEERKLLRKWKAAHKTSVLCMVFDSTSTLLATGSSDATIKIYDTAKHYYTHSFKGSQGAISLLKFHPNQEKLVLFSSSTEGKIRMWDLTSNRCVSILEGHFSTVTALVFSVDTSCMISCGRDKVVIIWDLSQRKQVKTIPVFECIEGMVIVPKKHHLEKEYFLTAGETGCLRTWSLHDGRCVYADPKYKERSKNLDKSHSSNILQLFYNDIIKSVVAVTFDHNIIFYDVCNLKIQKQFIGYYDEVLDIKFFGENEDCVALATNSEQIKVIHREQLTSEVLRGHTGTVLSIDVSYDGKYIASCSKDNTIRVWCKNEDNNEFCCVATGFGHTRDVGSIAWPKLSTDYIVTGAQDLTLKCWTLPKILVRSEIVSLSVKWTEKAHDKDINGVAISPNNKFVVSVSQDKTGKVWKIKSGKLIGTLCGHKRGIWCAMFSPVDQCIVTGSSDSTIKLWALSDFTCVKTFEGHTNSVLRVNFLHRGMQLVSSSSEGLIKIWDIRGDECVLTLEGHDEKAWALAVTKSEDMIVSGGADSTVKFWKDITEQTVKEEEEKQTTLVLREQTLRNLLQEKKFDKAIGLATTMNQPFTVLNIFKDMLYQTNKEVLLGNVIRNLQGDQIETLLTFICDWNTSAKHSYASQTVLMHILKLKTPNELLELSNMKETIESMLPYTERHCKRVNQLLQQSMFVDYTLESMKLSSIT
ncbi:transducin beta-like protein 3 [Hydractinia symbiolongicarpus]|uniref:transducin beta-like protein 3 n=1 Tax=Hydractinia symbiolongicarpus TaxID=13093 RepID=UPI00254AB820|nr:transducin beta-like protein 3 [Hydractinia symbiolongicarpus]